MGMQPQPPISGAPRLSGPPGPGIQAPPRVGPPQHMAPGQPQPSVSGAQPPMPPGGQFGQHPSQMPPSTLHRRPLKLQIPIRLSTSPKLHRVPWRRNGFGDRLYTLRSSPLSPSRDSPTNQQTRFPFPAMTISEHRHSDLKV